ncbi:DUF2845 domain-containing protein [Pseudomonas oryzihabitans]|uniref:DUF2845 domain-containing protein n=1 Tax=Pseudomonas oryzihabitans TaxID=47885 RepID=UPI0015E30B59|nr:MULTISPECIES: DUF2845 domain-containing protein [Pseudomonas]MBA1260341.1 DUF2845 domain-containing protein [Pseudomonas psychrotolerans]HJE70511.1 DUF2845 domain-containing protein [Pseudomonas oryzihabitans]
MRCLLAAFTLLVATGATADSMRCGNALVSRGDRAFEVLQKCGEPAHRDLVGYELGRNERREAVIEEWVYGPKNGANYILTFEANRLSRIEFQRQ